MHLPWLSAQPLHFSQLSRAPRAWQRTASFVALIAVMATAGCGRLKAKHADNYVYVTAKTANLRDRVAAVSNRTGTVNNGDKLRVLDHGRHWVKVQTDKGETGWIEEKAVATGQTAEDFDKLAADHKGDPEVADGVVRDTVYMHLKPGKDAEHYYLLPEGDKLKLLRRATIVKAVQPIQAARSQRAIPQASGTRQTPTVTAAPVVAEAGGPVMEDWWLVRDQENHTGWLYGRMLDVDAPEALTRYSEGQRIVGAYVLTTVHDAEAPNGPMDVPEYVTVSSPYKAGLPYDFDQVRVFVWSLKKHRYETAFRDHNVEGFLPVTLGKMKDQYGKGPVAATEMPSFSYKVLTADAPAVTPDPASGQITATKTLTKTYRLEGNIVRRMGAPGSTANEEVAHPVAEEKKGKKKRR